MEKLKPCPFCGKDNLRMFISSSDFKCTFYCKDCDTVFKVVDDKAIKMHGSQKAMELAIFYLFFK